MSEPCKENKVYFVAPIITLLGTLCFVGILANLIVNGQSSSYLIALICLFSFFALASILTLLLWTFRTMGLIDIQHAFGLPKGSVRALIALSIIAIFFVGGLYLYSDMSSSRLKESKGLTIEEVALFGKNFQQIIPEPIVEKFTVVEEINKEKSVTHKGLTLKEIDSLKGKTSQPILEPELRTFTVVVEVSKSESSVKFANSILTIIGTILSAISGFYFGSRSATVANPTKPESTQTPPPTPSISVIDPKTPPVLVQGQPIDITLQVQPAGEEVVAVVDGDPGGTIVSTVAGKFKYTPGDPAKFNSVKGVVLNFMLKKIPAIMDQFKIK